MAGVGVVGCVEGVAEEGGKGRCVDWEEGAEVNRVGGGLEVGVGVAGFGCHDEYSKGIKCSFSYF